MSRAIPRLGRHKPLRRPDRPSRKPLITCQIWLLEQRGKQCAAGLSPTLLHIKVMLQCTAERRQGDSYADAHDVAPGGDGAHERTTIKMA